MYGHVTELVIAERFLEIICLILHFQMTRMTPKEFVKRLAQGHSLVRAEMELEPSAPIPGSLINGALEREFFEILTVLRQTSKIALLREIVT